MIHWHQAELTALILYPAMQAQTAHHVLLAPSSLARWTFCALKGGFGQAKTAVLLLLLLPAICGHTVPASFSTECISLLII